MIADPRAATCHYYQPLTSTRYRRMRPSPGSQQADDSYPDPSRLAAAISGPASGHRALGRHRRYRARGVCRRRSRTAPWSARAHLLAAPPHRATGRRPPRQRRHRRWRRSAYRRTGCPDPCAEGKLGLDLVPMGGHSDIRLQQVGAALVMGNPAVPEEHLPHGLRAALRCRIVGPDRVSSVSYRRRPGPSR